MEGNWGTDMRWTGVGREAAKAVKEVRVSVSVSERGQGVVMRMMRVA